MQVEKRHKLWMIVETLRCQTEDLRRKTLDIQGCDVVFSILKTTKKSVQLVGYTAEDAKKFCLPEENRNHAEC